MEQHLDDTPRATSDISDAAAFDVREFEEGSANTGQEAYRGVVSFVLGKPRPLSAKIVDSAATDISRLSFLVRLTQGSSSSH